MIAPAENNNDQSLINYTAETVGNVADNDFAKTFREFQANYWAGEVNRFLNIPRGVNPMGSGADTHYRNARSFYLMMERANHEDRNNMVFGQGVNRLVANVMDEGFVLSPNTGDKNLDAEILAAFDEYAADPSRVDYQGEHNFHEKAALNFRASIVAGDQFEMTVRGQQFETVEGVYCRNPYTEQNKPFNDQPNSGIVHGVEIRNGKRAAYHFTPEKIGSFATARYESRRVSAEYTDGTRKVFHIYDPKRVTQRRGVTAIAPMVYPLKYHDDLQFAALVNAKRQSFIAILREFDTDADLKNFKRTRTGNRSTHTRNDGSTQTVEAGGPAQEYTASVAGEKLRGFTPTIPGQSHFEHAKMLTAIMAVNLDLPWLVFMLDARATNFNGYRGVIDQARLRFAKMQGNMISKFHRPAYAYWLREELRMRSDWRQAYARQGLKLFRHLWTPRAFKYIQPEKDVRTDDLRLNRNQVSPRRWAKERAMDWPTLSEEIIEDRAEHAIRAIERANAINKQYGLDGDNVIDWRELAHGQPLSGSNVSLTGELPMQAPETTENEARLVTPGTAV